MAIQNDLYLKVKELNSYEINHKGINILALSQIFIFELSLNRLSKKSFLNILKYYSLDSYVKAFLGIRLKKRDLNNKVEYVFINDIYNKSMISNIRNVESNFEKPFIELVCDKRVLEKNSIFLFRFFNFLIFIKEYISILKILKKNFSTIKEVSEHFNIKKRYLIFNILESVFIINCVKGFFNEYKEINKIVLNSDVHKVSRAITLLAKKKKIKTYVLQHGSTVLEYGYLPVMADYMFTWGELSYNWFRDRETKQKKLLITGTPKTDFIHQFNIDKSDIHAVKNILLILNPIGDENLSELLEIINRAELHIKYNLTIKLHPGSIDNRDLVDKYYNNEDIKILKDENIHQLIFENDIVITTTSTVGNEAIAFYKPLIKIVLKDLTNNLEYDLYNCSHSIKDSYSLKNLISDSSLLNSKKENYNEFIEKYFYKLDGKSSVRIISYLN